MLVSDINRMEYNKDHILYSKRTKKLFLYGFLKSLLRVQGLSGLHLYIIIQHLSFSILNTRTPGLSYADISVLNLILKKYSKDTLC